MLQLYLCCHWSPWPDALSRFRGTVALGKATEFDFPMEQENQQNFTQTSSQQAPNSRCYNCSKRGLEFNGTANHDSSREEMGAQVAFLLQE